MLTKAREKQLLRLAETNPAMFLMRLQKQMDELEGKVLEKATQKALDIKKGTPGYTPQRGVDYFTEDDQLELVNEIMVQIGEIHFGKRGMQGPAGKDAKPLIAGVDYPTKKQIHALVYTEIASLFALKTRIDKHGEATISQKDIDKTIGKIQEKLDFKARAAEIARALETLDEKNKLSFWALKDVPSFEKSEASKQGKGLIRGGGEKTEYYDLSAFCDGVTKVFTVPKNKKIIWVAGTDVPAGQYRQGTDYTGSGTTTLTLTGQVAAPQVGATLHIIYVP